ncbi:peptidase domain-containing ABC transporter [Synechococcus sp. LA31]|nr:peptidase domain-containing ABC transporter [Synechococcus sp. LA31]
MSTLNLSSMAPFDQLPADRLRVLQPQLQLRRCRLGQVLQAHEQAGLGMAVVLRGQLRVLGVDPLQAGLRSLARLGPGEMAGWFGVLSGLSGEQLQVASAEAELIWIPAPVFLALLEEAPQLRVWFEEQLSPIELHLALVQELRADLAWRHWLEHGLELQQLARLGSPNGNRSLVWRPSVWNGEQRLIGLPKPPALSDPPGETSVAKASASDAPLEEGSTPEPEAPDGFYALAPSMAAPSAEAAANPLRVPQAVGPRLAPLAICEGVAEQLQVPFDREALLDQIDATLQQQDRLNLVNVGQLLSSMGLRVVMATLPLDRLARVQPPAVLAQEGQLGVLDGVDPDGLARVLDPELGPLRIPLAELTAEDGELELLLLERTPISKSRRFSWGWFTPYVAEHRRELIEVFAASFVVNLLALATPLGIQVLVDQVARFENFGALLSISALLFLASLVGAVVRTLRSLIFTDVANRVDQATKGSILDRLVRLPQGFFDSRPVGQVTYYFNQLDRLREFLIGQSLTTLVDFLFSLLYIVVLVALNPPLTLVTLSTLPLIIILALVSNPIVESMIERSIGEAVKTYAFLTEAIGGIQTIKSQNAELKTRWEFQTRYSRFIGEDFKLRVTNETVSSLANFINELNGILVVGFGIWFVMKGQLTLGAFFAFRIISSYVTRPMVQLVQTWQQFKMSTEQIKMVGDIVDRQTEQSEEEATNIPMPPLKGDVAFQGVSFRFDVDAPRVLHGIDLEVPAGTFVGLVGGSGSGKSTLLKLLPRFYKAEEGQVLIDGLDINKVELYSLRRQIGVVPQDSLLFDGTIRDNLLLVKPDASTDDLIRAARLACAHDFIMAMPKGYSSSVGERGAGLSGGQRQRLALARAVLQNPRLLILDEATSALDARTERQVCLNLFEAFRGRTVFFITHRLSTVRPADLIVLMDQGAIMERGSHSQLMQQRGWYYALHQSQNQEGLS